MGIYVVVFMTCLIGSIIQSATSFGFAIFAMAVMPLFLPLKDCVVLVLLLAATISALNSLKLIKYIDFKSMIIPLGVSYCGRLLGLYLLTVLNADILKIFLAIVLMLLSVYFLFFKSKHTVKPTIANGIFSGATSGLMGGMFNTGGPPLVVYYFSCIQDKMVYMATVQSMLALGSLFSISLHTLKGNITTDILKLFFPCVIATCLGSVIGLAIYNRLDSKVLSKLVYSIMIISGIALLFK